MMASTMATMERRDATKRRRKRIRRQRRRRREALKFLPAKSGERRREVIMKVGGRMKGP